MAASQPEPVTPPGGASEPTDLWQPLRSIVGDEHVLVEEAAARYRVEGVAPRIVVRPGSVEELSQVMAFANRHRLATVPWGSGSQMHIGAPVKQVDMVCSLERLNRLTEYEPADMTLAVQAGMPLSELQGLLGEKGQFIPLDPPVGERSTIGGCLSTRAAGPIRAGFGTLRDRLLGVRAVLPDGRIAKAGGRVVKNVAGYDLGRLYTGAFGTLVVVTDIYLKVQPLPAAWSGARIALPDAAAVEAAMASLLEREADPAALEVINPALAQRLGWPAQWHLAVGYAGTPQELWYIGERLPRWIPAEKEGAADVVAMDWEPLHEALVDAHRGRFTFGDGSDGAGVTAKVHVLSSQVAEFLDGAGQDAVRHGVECHAAAHGMNGIVRLHVPAADVEKHVALLEAWRERARSMDGTLVVERAPAPVKEKVDVWGQPDGTFALIKAIKQRFDPHGILNPGRFIGGL